MGNLYEQTQTLQYVRDMILLEPENHPDNKLPLEDKLAKYPKNKSHVDDKAWGDFSDTKQPPKKKNGK